MLFLGGFVILLVAVSVEQRVRSAQQPQRTPGQAAKPPGTLDSDTPVPPLPEWTRHLAIRRAALDKSHLVQVLPDGTRVRYAIDPDLQQKAERLFRRYELPYAAVVVLSVRTGRVLAFAGSSKADPRLQPRDLALRAWAPAASVFKLITAAALVERNRARPMTRVCYHGGLRKLTAANLADDPKKDTECHTLADAIGKSLNPVIGKLALKQLERKELLETANRFGFNVQLPFDLPLQKSRARIPRSELARARVAAGFWRTTLSPLHAAMIAQGLANEGLMLRPRLVDKAWRRGGAPIARPERWRRRITTNFVARVVGRMMVLTTTVGTARDGFYDARGNAYLPHVKVAAKTGSLSRKTPPLDYNWLIGFAPYRRPRVAFAILLGNEVRWRTKPWFLARQLLAGIFTRPAKR